MITKPSIQELSQGKLNRYEITMVAAKAARLITDEYVKQREGIEERKQKNLSRGLDKVSYDQYMDPRYRDEKAVRVAVDKLTNNECVVMLDGEHPTSLQGIVNVSKADEDLNAEEAKEAEDSAAETRPEEV